MSEPIVVPEDADENWNPPGYEPGPDSPGPVTHVHDHGNSRAILPRSLPWHNSSAIGQSHPYFVDQTGPEFIWPESGEQ